MNEPTMKTDTKRATGRTTGLMLQAIGKAIENPGKEVEFIDHHHVQNHAQLQLCKERIEMITKKLNLDVSVSFLNAGGKSPFVLVIKSNWISPYTQRTSAEEAFKSVYGYYPVTDITDTCFDGDVWVAFQKGFEAAQK